MPRKFGLERKAPGAERPMTRRSRLIFGVPPPAADDIGGLVFVGVARVPNSRNGARSAEEP